MAIDPLSREAPTVNTAAEYVERRGETLVGDLQKPQDSFDRLQRCPRRSRHTATRACGALDGNRRSAVATMRDRQIQAENCACDDFHHRALV